MRAAFVALLAAVFVAGCVGIAPLKTSVKQSSNAAPAVLPDIDRLGVLVDGAVEYAGMNGKFLEIADSRVAIGQLAEETNAVLTQEGYTVAFTETPFVGGWLEQPSFEVAQNRDGKPLAMAPPFDAQSGIDPGYETALRNVSEGAADAFGHGGLLTDARGWSAEARDGLAAIAATKQIRYLLVVQGYGHIESGWRQAAEGVGTAVLSALFTLGTVAVSAHNVSWLNSEVMLVDLQTLDILWSNSLTLKNFNPAEPGDYDRNNWAGHLLHQLPARAKAAAGNP